MGACASVIKAPVSSGNEFQVVHAVVFPWPTNANTVSHPVSAWNIRRASDLSDPKQEDILWAAKYRKLFPVPNASHTSVLLRSCLQEADPTLGRCKISGQQLTAGGPDSGKNGSVC